MFLMDLSIEYGIPPQECLQRFTTRDFSLLREYARIKPFGYWRHNWHMAQLAQMYADVHTPKTRRPKLSDFMFVDQETRQQSKAKTFFSGLRNKAKKGRLEPSG